MPGSLIRTYLFRTSYDIISSPSAGWWHHVIVIAKREPSLLPLINQPSKIHAIIIARCFNLLLLPLAFVPVEVVWPSAGSPFQRVGMITKRSMHRGVAGKALIQSCSSQRQKSSLTRSCHASLLAIPGCVLLDIVHRTDTPHDHMVIVVFVAIVHVELPVALQGTIVQVIIHPLLHGYRNAVDTNLQRNHTLRGCIYITTIGTHACPRHTQQGGIFSLAHGHA